MYHQYLADQQIDLDKVVMTVAVNLCFHLLLLLLLLPLPILKFFFFYVFSEIAERSEE